MSVPLKKSFSVERQFIAACRKAELSSRKNYNGGIWSEEAQFGFSTAYFFKLWRARKRKRLMVGYFSLFSEGRRCSSLLLTIWVDSREIDSFNITVWMKYCPRRLSEWPVTRKFDDSGLCYYSPTPRKVKLKICLFYTASIFLSRLNKCGMCFICNNVNVNICQHAIHNW